MSEMIERVAKAMFLAAHPKSEWSRGASSAVWWLQAEAAVEAMRLPDLLDAAKDALAFIDRVEGHGYGGEADHMVAQVKLREAIKGASTETAEQRSERTLLSVP